MLSLYRCLLLQYILLLLLLQRLHRHERYGYLPLFCNGKVERAIGSVMMIIKKLLHGVEENWPLFAPFAQLSFHNKVAALTGSTPFSLMFGRELNEMKDYSTETPKLISYEDWENHQERIISLIYP